MRTVLGKSFGEIQNAHFMLDNFFFLTPCCLWEMWKSMEQLDWPQITIQYGACALHAR
jgi:hypothetical protein